MKDTKNETNMSWAYEVLKDNKVTNKRMFIIWIITFLTLIGVTSYTIYLLNDIESGYTTDTVTETIDIDGVEQIDNSHIKIGDDVWEKSE